jgi:hypothetical protein
MKSRATNDSGAALVLVLILVTVLSLGLLAVISLSTTSIRTTVALRSQASSSYAADAAAQILIDQIRRDQFTCTDPSATKDLPNFYPASGTAPGASAAVRCTPDPNGGGGSGGANASPGSAILTLGTSSEPGLSVNSNQPNQSVKVHGGIFSNSTINLGNNKSDLENTATKSYVYAMGNCTLNGSKIISNPAAVCNYSAQPQSAFDRRGKDPATVANHGASFDPPPAPSGGSVTPPACTNTQIYELQPGLYTNANQLNELTDTQKCTGSIFHLNPGRYYFNFSAPGTSHEWRISSGYLVGGTASSTLDLKKPPKVPGSCVAPGTAGATTSSGIQLIFGGDSRMSYANDASLEFCASNSPSGPPIAIHGLKQAVGSVPAQSGCVNQTPYPTTGCAVLSSDNSPKTAFTIQGTTYTPRSMIDITLNNNTVQVFRWGLITRGLVLNSTGSTGSLNNPVIDVPANAPAPFALPNIVYLEVFVCPGAGTCPASGTVQLRAKVLVNPDQTVKILSWSRPT